MEGKLALAQNTVLNALAGQIDDFYLAGGTALSQFYFHHRESKDLDFFTKEFSKKRVEEVGSLISQSLKKRIELVAEQAKRDRVRILVYSLQISKNVSLKIDFVEDYLNLAKTLRRINGINVLSIEDIYLRKIYAITGSFRKEDETGRSIFAGFRQEAKDYFDLYFLSHTFMGLSDFVFRFGTPLIREAVVRWFRTYSRMEIKTGLLELKIKKSMDYKDMERHFRQEVDRILEKEVRLI
ncbi:MAG: nucleotidyl transferase AbiEii/AbiGii toxin family protein [Candidatus Omnitrophota bacterium]